MKLIDACIRKVALLNYLCTMPLTAHHLQDLVNRLKSIQPNAHFQVWQLYGSDGHRIGCIYETDWLVGYGYAERPLPPQQQGYIFVLRLTDKGRELRLLGNIDKLETREINKFLAEGRKNWKERYWLSLSIFGWVIGVICGIAIDTWVKPLLTKVQQETTKENILKIQPTKSSVK